MSTKSRVHEILEVAKPGDKISRAFDIFILALITLNVLALIFGTVQTIGTRFAVYLRAFEVGSVAVFTIEYALRFWSCTVRAEYAHPITGRLRAASRFLMVVDLLAILPFFLPVIFPGLDLRFVRAIRLLRVFRVLKLGRYSQAIQTIGRVFASKRGELGVVGFVLLLLLVVSSSLLYFIENPYQPDKFSSIPATMWWAVATLTTVGYGDIYPITGLGKLVASFIAILGIGMFAIPAGVLSAGFSDELPSSRKCGGDSGETD